MKLVVGTRASQLSLAQTNWAISELKNANPDCEYVITTIKTRGDTETRPLFAIDQKGIFEKEIDRAVTDKKVDFAIHSLKDVPSDLAVNLVLACIPKRAPVNDVFISQDGSNLDSIKSESVIGTSSLRRAVQIIRKRPDLKVKPIRGNIETRIKKIKAGIYDAVVLAQAGISRLGLDVKFSILSTNDFPPSPGQGALGMVCRSDDSDTIAILKKIEDTNSSIEIRAERALSSFVESGCRFPVGAHATLKDEILKLCVVAYSVDGKRSIVVEQTGSKDDPSGLGERVGKELNKQGVGELASDWRKKVEEWNNTQ